jgi:hypothetical protein
MHAVLQKRNALLYLGTRRCAQRKNSRLDFATAGDQSGFVGYETGVMSGEYTDTFCCDWLGHNIASTVSSAR